MTADKDKAAEIINFESQFPGQTSMTDTDRRKLELWDDFIFYVRSRPCNCKFFLEHNCDRCKLLAKAAELDKGANPQC